MRFPYSDNRHPMNAVYEAMKNDPLFENYSEESIYFHIQNQERIERNTVILTAIFQAIVLLALLFFALLGLPPVPQ